MRQTLLILEDDDGVRMSMRLAMEDAGYDVIDHPDAEAALQTVGSAPVDAMLVDLMLGAIDGFSFIRRVRPETDAPIIVVSARSGTDDIVSALEAGADDYVSKPYVVAEVEARLKALLRRPSIGLDESDDAASPVEHIELDTTNGPLRLFVEAGMVKRGEDSLHLTSTEFRLLAVLAERPGRVLSREVLLERVWDHGYFGDNRIVDVHMRRLRQKVELDPSRPRMLVTVRGLGYRLDLQ